MDVRYEVKPSLNPRAERLEPSGIREIANAVARRREASLPVFPFHIGEPDFDTPTPISTAAVAALHGGATKYTPNAGIPELRLAIAQSLNARYGSKFHSADVTVTVGACEALTLAFLACLDQGDEVIVSTPCWPNYLQTPQLVGATVIEVPTLLSNSFRISPQDLFDHVTSRTKMIVLNSPNNPSGAVLAIDQIREILDYAKQNSVWVVLDEIYHDLVFDPQWSGALTAATNEDNLIYVNGFSKSYAMTGWRVGYVAAMGSVANTMQMIHQSLVTSGTSFAQFGALAALQCSAEVEVMRTKYLRRREMVTDALSAASLNFSNPAGGMYVFSEIPEKWNDASNYATHLLETYGIAVVPGSVFGSDYSRYFRLSFACDEQVLQTGLNALVSD